MKYLLLKIKLFTLTAMSWIIVSEQKINHKESRRPLRGRGKGKVERGKIKEGSYCMGHVNPE